MKKIIFSLFIIAAAAAVVVGGTSALFSDVETSNDNTFEAGSINLSLGGDFTSDNNGGADFALTEDVDGQAIFNFTDLKPGDMGEGSFEIDVTANNAYVCARTEITSTPENGLTEPEDESGDTTGGANGGELQNYLQFATFADDNGNGIYDNGEPVNVNQYLGDGDGFTLAEFSLFGWQAVSDTSAPDTWTTEGELISGTPQYPGLLYCFGEFETTGSGYLTQVTGCNSLSDDFFEYNVAQTDQVIGTIEFLAVQSRNNDGFKCDSLNVTVETDNNWSSVDLGEGKDWFAKARSNNGGFETAIGIDDTSSSGQNTGENTWVSGQSESFELVYDGAGNATLTIDGYTPISYAVGTDLYENIGITIKSLGDGLTEVENLVLDGTPVSPDNADTSGGSPYSITINKPGIAAGFILEGDFTFTWVTQPSQEAQAIQFSIN